VAEALHGLVRAPVTWGGGGGCSERQGRGTAGGVLTGRRAGCSCSAQAVFICDARRDVVRRPARGRPRKASCETRDGRWRAERTVTVACGTLVSPMHIEGRIESQVPAARGGETGCCKRSCFLFLFEDRTLSGSVLQPCLIGKDGNHACLKELCREVSPAQPLQL